MIILIVISQNYSYILAIAISPKSNFGMIPVAIWYEYHTSVFAVILANYSYIAS